MSKQNAIVIVIGILLIGGGSFFAGLKYGQSTAAPVAKNGAGFNGAGGAGGFGGGAGGQRGGNRLGGGNGGAGFANGEILSKDDKSVTIKLRDGGSKIIFFSGETQIMKAVAGATNDLIVGKQITVNGSANPDGSLNAQNIQLRPTDIASSTPNSGNIKVK